jgi:hypothetical protein
MGAANHDFEDDRLFGDVPPQDLDLQVGQGFHELRVEAPDFIPADVVRFPGTISILGAAAERTDNAVKIVLILEADMLLNESNARL